MKKSLHIIAAIIFASGIVIFIACQKNNNDELNPANVTNTISKNGNPEATVLPIEPYPIIAVVADGNGGMYIVNTATGFCPSNKTLYHTGIPVNQLSGVGQKTSKVGPIDDYAVVTDNNTVFGSFPTSFFKCQANPNPTPPNSQFLVTARGANYSNIGGLISDIDFKPKTSELYGIHYTGGNYYFVRILNWDACNNCQLLPSEVVQISSALGTYGFGAGPYGFCFEAGTTNYIYFYSQGSERMAKFTLSPFAIVSVSANTHNSPMSTPQVGLVKSGTIFFPMDHFDIFQGTYTSTVYQCTNGCYAEDAASFPTQ